MPIAGFGGEYNIALFKTWNFSSNFMLYFILTLTELLGIDDYEQNFHIRSWVVQLTCSMQQCFGLFSFSKRYVFPRNIVSSSWQFIHTISLLFAETILVELLWKLFPNFLSFVHFICSSLVLYVEMATSLPVKSWCEYFASIQHSLSRRFCCGNFNYTL